MAIVAGIWIYNVGFNIPHFLWSIVRTDKGGRVACFPIFHPIYILASYIFNFYVPLVITWTSYIGIIYKIRRSSKKVTSLAHIYFNHVVDKVIYA